MRSAVVASHRDQAEEVGSHLASSAAFSALRNQAISERAAIHQVRVSTVFFREKSADPLSEVLEASGSALAQRVCFLLLVYHTTDQFRAASGAVLPL